jgi:hypothetical protein
VKSVLWSRKKPFEEGALSVASQILKPARGRVWILSRYGFRSALRWRTQSIDVENQNGLR